MKCDGFQVHLLTELPLQSPRVTFILGSQIPRPCGQGQVHCAHGSQAAAPPWAHLAHVPKHSQPQEGK